MPGSVASGAATLVLARIVPPLASFGVFYLAVLHWGPDGWGLFHLLLSVHAVLQMVAGLGVDLMVLEKGSSKPQELPALLRAASGLLFRGGLFVTFAEPLLRSLRMEHYLPAAPILALLALALPAWFSTEILFRALVAKGRLSDCLRAAVLQVSLGVAALTWATKMYGVEGAAAAAVSVAWLGTAVYSFLLLQESSIPLRSWLRVLLIGATFVGATRTLAPMYSGYALPLIGMYTVAALALGAVRRGDLSVLLDVD